MDRLAPAAQDDAGRPSGAGAGVNAADVHALIWPDGTPGNVIDLHPRSCEYSAAFATTGSRQGGSGVLIGGGLIRPLLWSGTPDSVVSLLPSGFDGGTVAAMSGDQQVGYVARVGGPGPRAVLWTGTAESAVLLHPSEGFTQTTAEDTNGRQQVGYGLGDVTGGRNHALLWNGANAVVDLHRFLPAGAVVSFANGIDEDGTIVGSASLDGRSQRPVMWVPVPEPAGSALLLLPAVLLSRRTRGPRWRGA